MLYLVFLIIKYFINKKINKNKNRNINIFFIPTYNHT